jgi:hypothetical protein
MGLPFWVVVERGGIAGIPLSTLSHQELDKVSNGRRRGLGGSNQIVVLRKCRVEWLWMGGNVSRVAEHGDFFVS